MMVMESPATEILFGGESEGGKSHLLRIALITLCLACPKLQCLLVRKKFDDILKNHVEGPTGFKAVLAPTIKAGLVKVTDYGVSFPNGSEIGFQHCQDERQFTSAQGPEKHVLAVDEATQIGHRLLGFFRAWCRMPQEFKNTLPAEWRNKLPLIIYTANPIGPSTGWFRKNFIQARKPFEIESVHGFKRQFIPSSARDNLSIDMAAHDARLEGLNDPALIKALRGSWEQPTGDFFKMYDDERHTCPDFKPPAHWFKFRTFDWGSSDPFCVHWWCVSDGMQFVDEESGRKMGFIRACLICYREWYGCQDDDHSKGIDISNEEIAKGIRDRTVEKCFEATITDSLPFQNRGFSREGKKYRICDEFELHGVKLIQGNCGRQYGWKQIKDRLIGKDGFPLLQICESAKFLREYLPALQHHPNPEKKEDAQESGEATHCCDSARLACTTRPLIIDEPKPVEIVPGFKRMTPKTILLEQMRIA